METKEKKEKRSREGEAESESDRLSALLRYVALHLAVQKGRVDVVKLMVNDGAAGLGWDPLQTISSKWTCDFFDNTKSLDAASTLKASEAPFPEGISITNAKGSAAMTALTLSPERIGLARFIVTRLSVDLQSKIPSSRARHSDASFICDNDDSGPPRRPPCSSSDHEVFARPRGNA